MGWNGRRIRRKPRFKLVKRRTERVQTFPSLWGAVKGKFWYRKRGYRTGIRRQRGPVYTKRGWDVFRRYR